MKLKSHVQNVVLNLLRKSPKRAKSSTVAPIIPSVTLLLPVFPLVRPVPSVVDFWLRVQEEEHIAYDKWFDSKCAACIKEKGADEGCKQSTICNFILTEDPEFPTFYPALLKSRFGMFFRKSCIHTYQNDVDEVKEKLINPSMVKNCAIKGTFEYVWEARLILLPDKWFSTSQASFVKMDDGEMPESQAI